MRAKEFLEKEALARGFDVNEEKELIRKYQACTDPAVKNSILKKLSKIHRGTIISAIASSGSPSVSAESKNIVALNSFKMAIDKYNPEAGTKPSSFITKSIRQEINRENYKTSNETFMSEKHTILSQKIHTASKQLELEGKIVNPKSIKERIKDIYGKDEDLQEIERVISRTRRDLSGSLASEDNGETVTFEDIMNVSNISAQDVLNSRMNDTRLNSAMNTLSPIERDVFADRKGILGRDKESSWMGVALNNNLRSEHMAKKVYQQAELKIKKGLMGDGWSDR